MIKKSMKLICLIGCFFISTVLLSFGEESLTEDFEISVKVDYASAEKNINPLLYGAHTKWLLNGESSYSRDNGIWSKKDNAINSNIRDWLIKSGITILRYGDGTNADFFYWGWSIMPWKERLTTGVPTRWSADKEHYIFGVMEFTKLCETIKSEGIIIVNYGMGILEAFYDSQKNNDTRSKREIGIQQAANWVEFMNVPAPTKKDPSFPEEYKPEYSLQKMPKGYFAYLRASLGYPKPIGIKYWEIGNELKLYHGAGGTFSKQIKSFSKPILVEGYVRDTIEFGRAMKAVDPTIKIGLAYTDEFKKQVQLAGQDPEAVDFIVVHNYIKASKKGEKRVFAFYGNTTVAKRQVTVRKGGKYLVRLHAWGRAYLGTKYPEERAVPSKMELKIDDRIISEIEIDKNIKPDKSDLVKGEFHWYEIPVDLSPGSHTLSLRMTNDYLDPSFPDINRRGRDVFADDWLIEGQDEKYEIYFYPPDFFEMIYPQINGLDRMYSNLQRSISKYAPKLFIANTECSVYPSAGHLGEALAETLMIMVDMKNGVQIRNHFQLYGACNREGVIHTGDVERKSYHYTPTYLTYKMLSEHFGSELVQCNAVSPSEGEKASRLYTWASRESGVLYIAFVNFRKERVKVQLDVANFRPRNGKQYILGTLDPAGILADNETKFNNVFIKSETFNPEKQVVSLTPNSLTILELYK